MNTDRYTKAVLTAIALLLLGLFLQNAGLLPVRPNGRAVAAGLVAAGPQAALAVNPDGSLNVVLRRTEGVMDVNLHSVGDSRLYGAEVPVDIREVDGSSLFSGAIPVTQR